MVLKSIPDLIEPQLPCLKDDRAPPQQTAPYSKWHSCCLILHSEAREVRHQICMHFRTPVPGASAKGGEAPSQMLARALRWNE